MITPFLLKQGLHSSLIVMALSATLLSYGQEIKYHKKVIPARGAIQLDSNSILPGSFSISYLNGDSLLPTRYVVDWQNGYLKFVDSIASDSVVATYGSFSQKLNQKRFIRNRNDILDELSLDYEERRQSREQSITSPARSADQLNKVGSISRGVAFGNNQNLGVSSNLDLQLSGNLSEKYTLNAALSDRNIPIQPEGTTSNIQEFDQVFVGISGNGSQINLGDYFLSSNENDYFLKTYKKTQGISITQDVSINKDRSYQIGLNVGVARGKFARNTIQGTEGNQGPYRISGEAGELFIIVIAGTERVYVNGRLLERGEQKDYIIDYNSGELTFTPNQLITSLDRIVVEFQYADNSFERSIVHTRVSEKNKKYQWGIDYYSEQDNKNKPFYTTLSTEDVVILARAGDDLTTAFKVAEDSTDLAESTIRYQKIDTIVDGLLYRDIYVQTDDKDLGKYGITFSLVGEGNGDYVEQGSLLNGRVYSWVAPIDGRSQGNYAPIIRLLAPQRKRLIAGRLDYDISQKLSIRTDLAFSKNDINTFSALDAEDDDGLGSRIVLDAHDSLFRKRLKAQIEVYGEYTDENFEGIERFRSVEFNRTWNRQLSNNNDLFGPGNAVMVGGAKATLSNKNVKLVHGATVLNLPSLMFGDQQSSILEMKLGKVSLGGYNDFTSTESTPDSTVGDAGNFRRSGANAAIDFKYLRLGTSLQYENNLFSSLDSDSLYDQSFGFTQYEVFVENSDTFNLNFRLGAARRSNELSDSGFMVTESRSTDLSSKLAYTKGGKFQVNLNTTYRIFDDLNSAEDSLDNNTLLNRLEYRLRAFKGLLQTNAYYQIGTGRERQFEIQYLFVGRGLGDQVWSDINGNGKQDLGEFRPQEFNGQGDYVRTIVNSNKYVNAISNEFYQTINLVPSTLLSQSKGLAKALGRFSNQATGSINRKVSDNNNLDQFNPFALDLASDFLISSQAQLRNSLYFNRMGSRFSVEYSYLNLATKNLFVYGFESQEKKEHLFNMRWSFTEIFSLLPNYTNGILNSFSEAFENKIYNLEYEDIKLKGQFQKGAKLRFAINAGSYSGAVPTDTSVAVLRRSLGAEFTVSQPLKGVLTLKFDYIGVDFKGETNSPVGFTLLNGLQPGTNYTWSLITNYQLSKQAQVGINYEGRFSETNNVIQTGSVNARWLF